MKKLLTKFRRRLAYLLLADQDRCLLSNALLNYRVKAIAGQFNFDESEYHLLLRDMEGIYK